MRFTQDYYQPCGYRPGDRRVAFSLVCITAILCIITSTLLWVGVTPLTWLYQSIGMESFMAHAPNGAEWFVLLIACALLLLFSVEIEIATGLPLLSFWIATFVFLIIPTVLSIGLEKLHVTPVAWLVKVFGLVNQSMDTTPKVEFIALWAIAFLAIVGALKLYDYIDHQIEKRHAWD